MINLLKIPKVYDENMVRLIQRNFADGIVMNVASYTSNDGGTTELSYFGEYLERHTQTKITEYDIIVSTLGAGTGRLKRVQIYEGQLEGFLKRVEIENEKHSECGTDLDLILAIFLDIIGREDLSKKKLNTLIDNIKLDRNFLLIISAAYNGYITLDKELIAKLKKKILEETYEFDFKDLVLRIKERTSRTNMCFETEFVALKFINKVLGLKKSDFKDNEEIYEVYKSLRKFGSYDTDYDVTNKIFNLNEQEFYFLALKVANETYSPRGGALKKINEFFRNEIQKNLNLNSSVFYVLNNLSFETAYGGGRDKFSYNSLESFNELTKDYFEDFIKFSLVHHRGIDTEVYIAVYEREDFVEFIENEKAKLDQDDIRKIAFKVIYATEDINISKRYYELIKDVSNLNGYEMISLLAKGYITFESLIEMLFGGFTLNNNERLSSNENLQMVVESFIKDKSYEYLLTLIGKISKEWVKLNLKDKSIGEFIHEIKECFLSAISLENVDVNLKKSMIIELNDFLFMYDSKNYFTFIIENAKNELFKEALELSDEAIKEIGEYLLKQSYILSSSLYENKVKELVYDEEYIAFEEAKKVINNYVHYLKSATRCGYSRYDIDDFKQKIAKRVSLINDQKPIFNLFDAEIKKLSNEFHEQACLFEIVKTMIELEVIDVEESLEYFREKLAKRVMQC